MSFTRTMNFWRCSAFIFLLTNDLYGSSIVYNDVWSTVISSSNISPSKRLQLFERKTVKVVFSSALKLLHYASYWKCSDIASKLQLFEKRAVPDNEVWSRCQNCGFSNSKFVLFRNLAGNTSGIHLVDGLQLSSSLWREFFFTQSNDQYYSKISDCGNTVEFNVIERPVFILPMITFHIGHILIDLLEQVRLLENLSYES